MMCYRDSTFCPYYNECSKGKTCRWALTDKVKSDADKWWGNEGAPICVYDGKPECFIAKENTN